MKYRQVVDMVKKNMKARNDRLDIRSSRLQFTILAQARFSFAGMNPIKYLLQLKRSRN